jgi:hypothetical protein
MDRIVIQGGKRLTGSVTVSGSKNAALPILAASILCDSGECSFGNVPVLEDISHLLEILGTLGVQAVRGPDGRVTDADVETFAQRALEQPRLSADSEPERASKRPLAIVPGFVQGATPLPPLPDFTQWGMVERVPLRSVRRRIAEHMTLAYALIPHVSHFDRADITALEAFRQKHQVEGRERDAQLTLTTFVLKAAVAALKRHPRFHMHFTPTSSSWLNLVERWFGELTGKRIRRGVFVSVEDLQTAIEEFLAAWNNDPKPFVWTATEDSIVEKLNRSKQTLERIKPGCTRPRMRKNKGK